MSTRNIKLIDQRGQVVATAQVAEQGESFAGSIDLNAMPARLRQQFEEYEELVNGQMFGLLDEIEERISLLPLKVVFEEEIEIAVTDLQIYPRLGRVSFKVLPELARTEADRSVIGSGFPLSA